MRTLALFLVSGTGYAALLTTPPVIILPPSAIHLPNPSVIHLPPSSTIHTRRGTVGLLPAPLSASCPQLTWEPRPMLSWSGASTFRALVTRSYSLAVERHSGVRHKSLGWEPRAGLLSWRGASTFRALVKRNTCLSVCVA